MPAAFRATLTAVPGLTVGHWTHPSGATGCTVVLGPADGMRAACAVRGRATGTREIDALHPRHLVPRIDALLLSGGSAYGLGAADGVMRWLRDRKRGLAVGPAQVVPIVPTAILFDLPPDGSARWPGPDGGAAACDAAALEFAEGSVGAGAGASVGKATGFDGAMKGGLGTWAVRAGDVIVAALVVVNALGDVRDGRGEILAGARNADGTFRDARRYLADGGELFDRLAGAASNTTLAVTPPNAALHRTALEALPPTTTPLWNSPKRGLARSRARRWGKRRYSTAT
jgi:L-aminopeptidase/D-esterase-like protein